MRSLSAPQAFSLLTTKTVPSSSHALLQPSCFGRYHHLRTRKRTSIRPLATSASPPPPFSSPPPEQLYQPFHPPATLPSQFSSVESTDERLSTLRDRLGLWFEYAPLISTLARDGLSPPSIEEATGISGVEQNRLVVAAQVRLSLVSSGLPTELVAFFESSIGGPDILYELRLLSNRQRVDAARFVIDGNLDAKAARELARAIKDFPRRRSDRGWDAFSPSSPGDCLAFMYLRQSRENRGSAAERALELAAEAAETAKAKHRIMEEMKGGGDGEAEEEDKQVRVPVVRMRAGEAAESTMVVVLPVCRDVVEEVEVVPECGSDETFGIVTATAGWRRWVVLPGWETVAAAVGDGGLVAVEFKDGKVLPWKAKKTIKEEGVLVVVDRRKKGVEEGSNLYLVAGEGGGVVVERGSGLVEKGVVSSLGSVLLVVRPPKLDTEDLYLEDD
ncbi:Rubisco accumulation factor 2 [Nymphaea thermarum]|nr:Rubisco accumulation factor 2 [Nymphaea thermarum]